MGKQHFLASAKVRDMSICDFFDMTNEKAFLFLAEMRWGQTAKQGCPDCGVFDKHYFIRSRKQWRCKHCFHTFSVTSKTIFSNNRLPYRKLLLAIYLFTSSVQGKSMLELSRNLKVNPKTAWLLFHKIREALIHNRDNRALSGVVQIDGTYIGGKPRRARLRKTKNALAIKNKIEGQPKKTKTYTPNDLRNWYRRKEFRRLIIVVRELHQEPKLGAMRTLVFLTKEEKEVFVKPIAKKYIQRGSTVMTDENGAYNFLSAHYDHRTVEHSKEYAADDGTNNNQAESYNSRLKRWYYGTTHKMMPQYAFDYANEMAWREDSRGKSEKERYDMVCRYSLNTPPSKWWRGYHQGMRRNDELLMYGV
ncbi:MAG: IS1595 family transposase [Pseudomonadota bacterium]